MKFEVHIYMDMFRKGAEERNVLHSGNCKLISLTGAKDEGEGLA